MRIDRAADDSWDRIAMNPHKPREENGYALIMNDGVNPDVVDLRVSNAMVSSERDLNM